MRLWNLYRFRRESQSMKHFLALFLFVFTLSVHGQGVTDNSRFTMEYRGVAKKTESQAARNQAPACATAASVKVCNKVGKETIYGSGTVVAVGGGKGLVLTCFHLFEDERHNDKFICGDLLLTWSNGATCKARYVGNDKTKADLAALSFDTAAFGGDSKVAFVPVADTPQPSKDTWHVGYPFGGSAISRTGHIALDERVTPRELHATFGSEQGESGGGIFRSDGKALVGVLWGKQTSSGTALGVPRSETRRFAEAAWRQCFLRDRIVLVPQVQPVWQQPVWQAPVYTSPNIGFDPGIVNSLADIRAGQQIIMAKLDMLRSGCSGAGVSIGEAPMYMPPAALLPPAPAVQPAPMAPSPVRPPVMAPTPAPPILPSPTTSLPPDGISLACPPGKP